MKRLFITFIILCIIYMILYFLFPVFNKGEHFSYEIKKEGMVFFINEKSNFRLQDNLDNYQFEIKSKNRTFHFQIFYDFEKTSNVITDIIYYNDSNYECLLPIYKDNIVLSDMMCYEKDELKYYQTIKGQNSALDDFVRSTSEYKAYVFKPSNEVKEMEGIEIYKENLIDNHYVEITNYQGIYNISSNFNSLVYKISLYNKDIYNQKIAVFTDQYYLSADYNQAYEFNKFNIIDFVRPDTYTIVSNEMISLDSYIQGMVDGKIYLYDKDYQKQYEINIDKKTVTLLSDKEIKYYNNGNWETMTVEQAKNELKFTDKQDNDIDNTYDRVDKIGNEFGYIYSYKKNGDQYDVYRSNIGQGDSQIYLFSTQTISNVCYMNNYVYFIDKDTIKVYHDNFGVRPLVHYKELEFNKNMNFYVYTK